jgi:hypothetical protein
MSSEHPDRQIVSVDHGRTMVRGTAGNMCKGERRDGEGERGGINTGKGEPGKGSTWLAWIRGRGTRKGLGLGKWWGACHGLGNCGLG